MASRIVDRDCDTRKVDKGLKNPWKWEWLERKVGDELICRFIWKLSSRGLAFCELCSKEVNYARRGWKAFHHLNSICLRSCILKIKKIRTTKQSLSDMW